MDLNMKQWRSQQQHESDLQQPTSGKLTRHLLDPQLQQQQQTPSALPNFVPELTGNLSAESSTPATRSPKRQMGSYFSLGQWQELELQALIFRHMLAGAAIPPHLLHLVKKSVLNNSSSPSYNYLHQQLQHYPHYHPPLLQSGGAGCWGRGGMDPEPGRCRRTDGKKWRCSRDVVAGHKYCERHMHRGRNRSRKPVEIPPLRSSSSSAGGLSGGGGGLKAANSSTPQPLPAMAAGTHFNLSRLSPSIDLFHLNQRPSDSGTENKGGQLETQNEVSAGDGNSSGGQVLRHFFDDWPRSLQDQPENASSVITSSSTSCSLSICSSTLSNPNSDFSLKLSTGNININRDHREGGGGGRGGGSRSGVVRGQQLQLNWVASWGTNQVVGPMGPGGPLAEALRSSSSSSSSPAGVLNRSAKSDTSYVTT